MPNSNLPKIMPIRPKLGTGGHEIRVKSTVLEPQIPTTLTLTIIVSMSMSITMTKPQHVITRRRRFMPRHEVKQLISLPNLPPELLDLRQQLGLVGLELRHFSPQPRDLLGGVVKAAEETALLLLPSIAVSSEDLDHPSIGLGVFLPP